MIQRVLPLLCCLLFAFPAAGQSPVYVGFDGEYGLLNSTSAQSIERGIRIALEEINAAGGVLGGRPLELLTRDNRSVPARGIANLQEFAATKDLVAVVGGRFSPVLLEQIPVTHELKVPLLDAWGSATGITHHDRRPSYTFRLSLFDRIGMPVMLNHAVGKGAGRIGLLVPNTGWGRSNAKEAQLWQADHAQIELLTPVWYNWGEQDMLRHYLALRAQGAEAIVLVANDIEGSRLVQALGELGQFEELVPVIAHWGVTGGEFVQSCGDALFKIDFSVIQTFSFFNPGGEVRERVLTQARHLFGLERVEEIESPVGLAHAYDLMHILARAIDLAGSTDRSAVRDALEQVRDYRGLTGDYPQPFTAERHDAMRSEQVFMARYRRDGAIIPISIEE